MNIHDSNCGETGSTHALLSIEEDDGLQWNAEDLEPVWRLLLSAALDDVLSGAACATSTATADAGIASRTVREFLMAPSIPADPLRQLKEFAKENGVRREALLPREVCSALYFICIQLACRNGLESLTDLSPDETRKGIAWVLEQPWVDADLKPLLETPE